MADDTMRIAAKCLFCDAALTGPENSTFESGDLITCPECGEGNDFDSVVEVAKEKSLGIAKKLLNDKIKSILKK